MMKEESRPLWAPWRIEYIRSPKAKTCFLCVPREDFREYDLREHVLSRGNSCYAILNRYPYNSGHLLIAPFRHVGDLSALTDGEQAEMMRMCVSAKNTLCAAMAPEGFNIGLNLGRTAGAGVEEHIHMHVVPRWAGDTNYMPVISSTHVVPEALDETARLLRESWTQR